MPYISASIFMQIAGAVLPQIDKMQKEEEGRKRLNQWTALHHGRPGRSCRRGASRCSPSRCRAPSRTRACCSRCEMVLFLTTGAVFVMWLGEQITERGVGNGASLIIFFSIVERFWPGIFDTFRYISTGATNVVKLIVLGALMVAVVAGVDRDHRRGARSADPDSRSARWRAGGCAMAPRASFPLRINSAGVMPIIFAQSVIVVPGAIAQFTGQPAVGARCRRSISPGIVRSISCLMAVLIIFFTYFYTSIIFNPVDLAENLKKQGGFIPGVKPGTKTAEYIDEVMSPDHAAGRDLPDVHRAACPSGSPSRSTCRSGSAARRC